VEAVAISQPERTTEDFLAPLSDEIVSYLNSLQTISKVIFQEGCFVRRFLCCDLKVPIIQNTNFRIGRVYCLKISASRIFYGLLFPNKDDLGKKKIARYMQHGPKIARHI
jgi:hypothetical protein